MTLTLVSVLLALLNLASAALIADRRRVGWLVALGAQIPWTWYDVWTRQFGFLLLTLLYVPVGMRGWRKARHHRPTVEAVGSAAHRNGDGRRRRRDRGRKRLTTRAAVASRQPTQHRHSERQDRAQVGRMACAGSARRRGCRPASVSLVGGRRGIGWKVRGGDVGTRLA